VPFFLIGSYACLLNKLQGLPVPIFKLSNSRYLFSDGYFPSFQLIDDWLWVGRVEVDFAEVDDSADEVLCGLLDLLHTASTLDH